MSLKNTKAFVPKEKRKCPSAYYPQISNFPNVPVNVSLNSNKSKYKNRNVRPNSNSMGSTTSSVDYTPYYDGSSMMTIPLYQPYVKLEKNVPQKLHNQILKIQKTFRCKATEGNVMIDTNELSLLTNEGPELFKK